MKEKLLNRYLSGDATKEEKEEVLLWLNSSAVNMHEFLTLRKLFDITTWQNSIGENVEKDKSFRVFQIISPKVLKVVTRIAAVLILVIAFSRLLFDQADNIVPVSQTIYIPAGQRAEVILSDGSKVWLNSNTTFKFPSTFDSESREVSLNGEGYFEVAHDNSKSFRVKTDKFDIKVFGTEFNVLAYAEVQDFEVSLIEGSVEVLKPNAEKGVMLKPHEIIFIKDNRLYKSYITHNNYFLWKEGIISFDNEPFQEIIKKLELYFDLKIIVKNDPNLLYRYTGKFRSKDGIEHILKVLQLRQNFNYTIDNNLNIITIN